MRPEEYRKTRGMEEGQEELGERGGSRRTTGKMMLGWWDQMN
jgi:hypothetical protein